MQSPRTALWGNRLGALSMALAVIWAFLAAGDGGAPGRIPTALVLAGVGAAAGIALGQAVKMIHMPQTVALLNGLGGAASALVAWAAVLAYGGQVEAQIFWATSGIATAAGALTLGGSLIAGTKLQGLAFQRPYQVPGHGYILRLLLLVCGFFIALNMAFQGLFSTSYVPLIALLGLLAGVCMALRIGGADMPIIISLLNSLSGVAAAVTGLAVENLILTGTGALVGVAGLILTRIMCRAMNRSLLVVLTGFTPPARPQVSPETEPPAGVKPPLPVAEAEREREKDSPAAERSGEAGAAPAASREAGEEPAAAPAGAHGEAGEAGGVGEDAAAAPAGETSLSEDRLPALLQEAARVVIVPGYGMAVAQAQQAVRQLVDALEQRGKEVKIAIHPVAGRMPGHMNVLLAEAGIDYEKLLDMDAVNPQFPSADLAIVVGACDVVNPAANTVEGTPISGMPILNAEQAKHVIICNLDENPGYSGVENSLYRQPHVITLWGDAAQTVPRLTTMLQENETPAS